MTSPPLTAPAFGPEHVQALAEARQRSKKIRRAVSWAKFDGWGVGVFGALSLLIALPQFSITGILVGAGLCAVAWIELAAARDLAKLDLRAPKRLAYNQLLLGFILFVYACYMFWQTWYYPEKYVGDISQLTELGREGQNMAMSITQMVRLAGALIYGALIVVSIVLQGGTAIYYKSRRRYVEAYLRETPEWVVQMQRAGVQV